MSFVTQLFIYFWNLTLKCCRQRATAVLVVWWSQTVVSLSHTISLKEKLTCIWGARTTTTWNQVWFLFLIFYLYLCTYSCINFIKPRHTAYFKIKQLTLALVVMGWRWRNFNLHSPKIGLGLSLKKLPMGASKYFLEWFVKGRGS